VIKEKGKRAGYQLFYTEVKQVKENEAGKMRVAFKGKESE
jgi:hypothetical protein